MRAYFSVFRMRLRMETQYRGAAIGGIACQIFFGLILVALYRALYAGKPQDMLAFSTSCRSCSRGPAPCSSSSCRKAR